jgi:hypothetical protein
MMPLISGGLEVPAPQDPIAHLDGTEVTKLSQQVQDFVRGVATGTRQDGRRHHLTRPFTRMVEFEILAIEAAAESSAEPPDRCPLESWTGRRSSDYCRSSPPTKDD